MSLEAGPLLDALQVARRAGTLSGSGSRSAEELLLLRICCHRADHAVRGQGLPGLALQCLALLCPDTRRGSCTGSPPAATPARLTSPPTAHRQPPASHHHSSPHPTPAPQVSKVLKSVYELPKFNPTKAGKEAKASGAKGVVAKLGGKLRRLSQTFQ
jgi:hypothetical protein